MYLGLPRLYPGLPRLDPGLLGLDPGLLMVGTEKAPPMGQLGFSTSTRFLAELEAAVVNLILLAFMVLQVHWTR